MVRACHRAGVPWVARGAGSGLSGGALPVEDGVLISLTRMRRILEVDLDQPARGRRAGRDQHRRLAGGRPGPLLPARPVVPDRLHDRRQRGRELRRRALLQVRLHHQLRDRARAGAARRRAGAAAAARSSTTRATTCSARSSAPRARSAWPPRSGCGSCPKPETVRTLVAFFGSPIQAGEVVSEIVSGGIVPGAIEMMDNLSIRAAEGYTNAGYPTDAGAALVVELDGSEAECETRFDEVVAICERAGADSIRVAARRGRARADLARRARRPSPRWAGSRPTTTCRTA